MHQGSPRRDPSSGQPGGGPSEAHSRGGIVRLAGSRPGRQAGGVPGEHAAFHVHHVRIAGPGEMPAGGGAPQAAPADHVERAVLRQLTQSIVKVVQRGERQHRRRAPSGEFIGAAHIEQESGPGADGVGRLCRRTRLKGFLNREIMGFSPCWHIRLPFERTGSACEGKERRSGRRRGLGAAFDPPHRTGRPPRRRIRLPTESSGNPCGAAAVSLHVGGGIRGRSDAARSQVRSLHRDAMAQIVALLTPAQRTALRDALRSWNTPSIR